MKITGKESAFPTKPKSVVVARQSSNYLDDFGVSRSETHNVFGEVVSDGMDIRTYLAGKAMQGILSHSNLTYNDPNGTATKTIIPSTVALLSVEIADALINELNKEKK